MCIEKVEVNLHAFSAKVLDGGQWSATYSGRFILLEVPPTEPTSQSAGQTAAAVWER
jgi:hypothetical protein